MYNYPSPNTPQGNPCLGPSMPYAYPHPHQQIPGPTIAPLDYSNFSPSHYYQYAQPSATASLTLVP